MAFDLKNYEDVQSRVKRFQEAYPMGRIQTTIVEFSQDKGFILVKAEVFRDDVSTLAAGTDFAYGNVIFYPTHMKRFFCEDTITSSIGRAISLVLPVEHKSTAEDMSRVAPTTIVSTTATMPADTTDYWNEQYKAEDSGMDTLKTATELLEGELGAVLLQESPICLHGHMTLREGEKKDKEGILRPYRGFVCTEKERANQCPAQWMVMSATTGEWRFR